MVLNMLLLVSQKYWFSYMTRWWTDFIMNWRRDYAFSINNKMPYYLKDHTAQVHSWSKIKWNLATYMDFILFCTSSYICVAIFAVLGCFMAWLAVCNIPEELKTSSMPQQKPKFLQHLFFSVASVLYISVHMKYVSIHPCSAVVTISPTKFPFCCSARWRNTNAIPFHLTTMTLLTTMSCIPN